MWRSLVARFVRDEEVVGSNPATPTELRGERSCSFTRGEGEGRRRIAPNTPTLEVRP